jgi:peroxiredoxin
LPGFINHFDDLKAKGVDTIACMAVNDVFVMKAWGESSKAAGKVEMLADGNGDYARALGLELDASKFGMGKRSKRFSMIVDNGIVKALNIEPPGEFGVSSAESALQQL